MDLLLHAAEDSSTHRPDPRGRLSTVGHRTAFRAFARAAKKAGVRFMVIGGTFRDVAIRAASTQDIDIVLVDQPELPTSLMEAAGFTRMGRSVHVWQYESRGRTVRLEVAAIASSQATGGPFSVAFQQAQTATIEGLRVVVPQLADYVILKLIAAAADSRRRARDLADIQYALERPDAEPRALGIPSLRARMRDLYGLGGERLKRLVALLRQVPRH